MPMPLEGFIHLHGLEIILLKFPHTVYPGLSKTLRTKMKVEEGTN